MKNIRVLLVLVVSLLICVPTVANGATSKSVQCHYDVCFIDEEERESSMHYLSYDNFKYKYIFITKDGLSKDSTLDKFYTNRKYICLFNDENAYSISSTSVSLRAPVCFEFTRDKYGANTLSKVLTDVSMSTGLSSYFYSNYIENKTDLKSEVIVTPGGNTGENTGGNSVDISNIDICVFGIFLMVSVISWYVILKDLFKNKEGGFKYEDV